MPVNETTLASQIFDQLQQAMACNPAGFTELYRDYLADAWQTLGMLRKAAKQQQMEELCANAHHLKGSSMVLGACAVTLCATTLEEMGRNSDVQHASASVEKTREALQQVQDELSSRLGPGVVPASEMIPSDVTVRAER